MSRCFFALGALGALVAALSPGALVAQDADPPPTDRSTGVYFWYDEAGRLHVTDQIEEVPAVYRADALARDRQGQAAPSGNLSIVEVEVVGPEAGPELREEPAPQPPSAEAVDDLRTRDYWQKQLADQRERKAQAEAELKRIEAELGRVNALRPAGFHETLIRLDQERQAQLETLEDAQRQIDVEIPERARQLDIPPGWLR